MRIISALSMVAGCFALAACAAGPRVPRYTERFEREVRNTANPGSVVAGDIGFSRAAREDGQWRAFRERAAAGAVIHAADGPIDAASWTAQQAEPAAPRQWTPLSVWSSCDGRTALSLGKYADPDVQWGYYLTVWERQRDYDYEYVYHIAAPDAVLTARETADRTTPPDDDGVIVVRGIPTITGEVADCPGAGAAAPAPPMPMAADGARSGGATSADGTLAWRWTQNADGGRELIARHWQGGAWQDAVRFAVSADGRFERRD